MALTQNDFNQIEQLMDDKLDEKLKILPTKDDFFNKMDEVVGELKTTREEQIVLGHQVADQEKRLVFLEGNGSVVQNK